MLGLPNLWLIGVGNASTKEEERQGHRSLLSTASGEDGEITGEDRPTEARTAGVSWEDRRFVFGGVLL